MTVAKPRLTMEQQAEIIDLFTAGYTINDISETHRVGASVVLNVLRYHGVITSRTGRPTILDKWNAEDLETIVERYKSGEHMGAIRTDYGITQGQLRGILDALGIPARKLLKEAVVSLAERLDEAVRMYQEGFLLLEIQAETGVAGVQLYDALRRRKIPTRTQIRTQMQM